MKSILCRLGLHYPINYKNSKILFDNAVTGNPVLVGRCPCGKEWMVEMDKNFPGFKLEKD